MVPCVECVGSAGCVYLFLFLSLCAVCAVRSADGAVLAACCVTPGSVMLCCLCVGGVECRVFAMCRMHCSTQHEAHSMYTAHRQWSPPLPHSPLRKRSAPRKQARSARTAPHPEGIERRVHTTQTTICESTEYTTLNKQSSPPIGTVHGADSTDTD